MASKIQTGNRITALRVKACDLLNKAIDLEWQLNSRGLKITETIKGKVCVFVCWKEQFYDEDTLKSVWIDRRRIISINGTKVGIDGQPLKYYKIS